MKYLYRHTRAFRRVLGRSKKFKKGIFRTEEGGVVEHERYQAPLKINEVFPNDLIASLFTVLLLFSTVSKQKRGWAKTSFRIQKNEYFRSWIYSFSYVMVYNNKKQLEIHDYV